LIIRKNADDLKEWIEKSREFYRPMRVEIMGNPPVLKFPNGALFWTGHLAHEESYEKYIGWEIPRMLIEELNQIPTEEQYVKILSCCRSTLDGIDARVFSTTNPGGRGHVWIKKRWQIESGSIAGNGKPPYETVRIKTERGDRVFIPATIDDNPIAKAKDPTYESFLMGLPETLKQAWWKGDWTVFSGQFFDLNPNIHRIEPFEIPDVWPLWGGLDYGETHATAFGLYTRDPETEQVIRITEYVQAGLGGSENARSIKDKMENCQWTKGRMPDTVEAGTDLWVKRTGVYVGDERIKEAFRRSTADEFIEYGFNVVPANTDRVMGWRRCNEYLHCQNGKTKFAYFKGENPQFEIVIPAMIHSKTNPEDVQKQNGDDVADEWRYAMMGDHEPFDMKKFASEYVEDLEELNQGGFEF